MQTAVYAMLMVASLSPTKGWFAPDKPITVRVVAEGEQELLLTDFNGRELEAKSETVTAVTGEKVVDLRELYIQVGTPGTYVLYLTKKEGSAADFTGTPLVVGVREDRRRGAPAGAMVVRVEPLRYAVIHTAAGPMTAAFYYDVAPNTVNNFISLAADGYYDGLTFHRIVPGFVIQAGDPRGDGTGGPGYMIDAEFSSPKNNHSQHEAGALSMARTGDPGEGPGVMPRPEFANSAGSQFFVCLDYKNTQQLDGKYTVFGKIVGSLDAVNKIAAAPLADARSGRPKEPQVIERVEVKAVVPGENPYVNVLKPREMGESLR